MVIPCISSSASAKSKPLAEINARSMNDVLRIAKAIGVVQPYLDDTKYLEYAMGIYRAARRYGVEPSVLISITKQETSFREDLPEGAAGEIGICQIRKMWLKQKKFVREFGRQTIKDLKKPSKNFLFAAWILKELKKDYSKGSLPYWSYYNAVRFEPRLRYFVAVNKHVTTLKRNEHVFSERVIAESDNTPPVVVTPVPAPAPQVSRPAVVAAAAKPAAAPPARTEPARITPVRKVAEPRVAEWIARAGKASLRQPAPQVRNINSAPETEQVAVSEENTTGGRWIPNALMKVQKQAAAQHGSLDLNHKKALSQAVMRAASELDVAGFFSATPIED
jgi:hypothetical protein